MRAILLALLAAAPLLAQSGYQKHYFTGGVGAGVPGGNLSGSYKSAAGVSIDYGYRFQKNLQADVGFQTLFGSAGVRAFMDTELGYVRIRDLEYFFPFGGRAILPLQDERILLSFGGGGAYLRYSERIKQVSAYYNIQCPDCASRGGWGTYAQASASYALDSAQLFRVGFTARAYRVNTSGGLVGDLPATETRDRWLNLFANFTVSF
jgi:hypothetical protein